MSKRVLAITELGEKFVTADILLSVIHSAILSALNSGAVDDPTFSYLCATVNLLGHQGFLEVRDRPVARAREDTPGVDTSEAPSFITEAFKDLGGGGGNATDKR